MICWLFRRMHAARAKDRVAEEELRRSKEMREVSRVDAEHWRDRAETNAFADLIRDALVRHHYEGQA